jgi:hypothetical protein
MGKLSKRINNKTMRTTPEITEDSSLGQFLIGQASKAAVVVEIGTGCGIGSTKCLYEGARKNKAHQTLITIEACYDQWVLARENMEKYCGYRPLFGCLHRTIRPFWHPANREVDLEMWQFEHDIHYTPKPPPLILESTPKNVDLLFLDGGEFTSDGDFLALWERARVIVLDDCNQRVATKNVYGTLQLARARGWKLISPIGSIDDRNGWTAFERI